MWTELPKTGKGGVIFLGVMVTVCCSRQEEGQARQQGPLHLEDVPEGRQRHPGPQEPPGRRWSLLDTPPAPEKAQSWPEANYFSWSPVLNCGFVEQMSIFM